LIRGDDFIYAEQKAIKSICLSYVSHSFSTTADYIIGKNSVNEPAGVPLTSFWIIIKAIGIGAVVGVLFAAIPCRKIVFKPLLTVQTSSSISENVPSGIQVENAATTAGWRDREDVKTMDALKSTQKNGSVDEHFNFFKSRFARVYSSSKEEIRRKKLFEGNLNIINAMNKQHPLAFFAVNHYADYSEGEKQMLKMNRNPIENLRKAFYGITPSTTSIFSASSTGWLQANDCAGCELYPDLINITIDNMPKSIDWRNLGAVTNVKKQQVLFMPKLNVIYLLCVDNLSFSTYSSSPSTELRELLGFLINCRHRRSKLFS